VLRKAMVLPHQVNDTGSCDPLVLF